MPFKITCPNGHAMMIRDEYAGRRVKCPTCKEGMLAAAPGAATNSVATPNVPPPSAPMARIVMDATLVEEEDQPPDRRPPRRDKRRKEKPRRKRLKSTQGLGLVSAGLILEIGRIALMAISIVAVFSLAFFSAPAALLMSGGFAILAHAAGLAVIALCLTGTRQTGGATLIALCLAANLLGMLISLAGMAVGPGTPVYAKVLLGLSGIALKLAGWILFVAYLKQLAASLAEAEEDSAAYVFRFTVIVVAEAVLIYFVMLLGAVFGPHLGLFGLVFLGIVLAGALWFIAHCIWYLVSYLRLLAQLRGTIARLRLRAAEAEPEQPGQSRWGWVLASMGLIVFLLVGAGVAAYVLIFPGLRSLPPPVVREQNQLTREFGAGQVLVVELRGIKPGDPDVPRVLHRLGQLASPHTKGHSTLRGCHEGERLFFVVGGVEAFDAFVDSVDFGKVTSVSAWQRQFVIDVDRDVVDGLTDPADPEGRRTPESRRRERTQPTPPATGPSGVGESPPPSAAAPPRRENPIARWSFDDEAGDVVKDVSGSGLHGRLVACNRVPGIRGKAIEFAGEGSYFDYSGGPALHFEADAPVSIAFWFRTSERGGTLLCQRKRGQEAQMIRLTFDPFGISAEVCADQQESTPLPARVNATLKVNDGQWHHVTLLRSGNDLELYVDGELRAKATNPVAGGAITTDLRHLGADGYQLVHGGGGAHPHFKGAMDEVSIYVRELSPEEIRKLASK